MKRRSLAEIAAIALVLSALALAASSLIFDDAASMARSAQEAYRQDSRAATFRDTRG